MIIYRGACTYGILMLYSVLSCAESDSLDESIYFVSVSILTASIYVDHGIPYKDGPLSVAEITVQPTTTGIPKHAKG